MKLNKTHKNEIITGTIDTVFLFSTLYSNNFFEKPDLKPTDNSTAFQSFYSSTQTIFQLQQNNYRVTNVSIEYIGFKNIIHYQTPTKKPENRVAVQPIINIKGNNSSNINTALVNGNLTQIVNNPLPRNLTKEQTEEILLSIPKDYAIEIRFPHPNQEADGLSDQIMDLLNKLGRKAYKIRTSAIETITRENFSIKPSPNKPDIMILTVSPQK
jgi:hypothetical protein